MLVLSSKLRLDFPVLSVHLGRKIAGTASAIVDPEQLRVIAFRLKGDIEKDPEAGDILMIEDVREVSKQGLIIDSVDRLVEAEEVVKLKKILALNFDLLGLKVVTRKGKDIGKVIDYTIDTGSFMVFQLIVKKPFWASFEEGELTINRSQIVEIDDYKITIKNDKEEVKVGKSAETNFKPDFINPFRKAKLAGSEKEG